jgi:hypothetical protein
MGGAHGVASSSAGVEGLTADTHTDSQLETRFARAVLGGTALGVCSEEGWGSADAIAVAVSCERCLCEKNCCCRLSVAYMQPPSKQHRPLDLNILALIASPVIYTYPFFTSRWRQNPLSSQ